MIRRLNKIISLVAVSTIIGSALPAELLNNNVSAAVAYEELQLDNESNIVALASTQEEAALEVVLKAMLPTKAGYAGSVVSDFSKCGTISYELDNTAAQGIAQNLGWSPTRRRTAGIPWITRARRAICPPTT